MVEALIPYMHQEAPAAPVPEAVRQLRAKLHETVPTLQERTWTGMPKPYKQTILRAARLDPARECMPWRLFNRDEVEAIRDALIRLERLNQQLKGMLK